MIYGDISHISQTQLASYPPVIAKVINYLRTNDLNALTVNEKYFIADKIFFTVVEPTTKPLAECKPEVHRQYLDVHFLISGRECISVAVDDGKHEITENYAEDRDLIFLSASRINDNFITLEPGQFVVAFPEDIHRPLCMIEQPQKIKKTVVKIDICLL